jgi:hypothetical protein
MWRFFGSWEFLDRGGDFTASLVFKGENRHAIGTEITPLELGFAIGSTLPTGAPFGDADWLLTNLFWKQQITDRAVLMFGQLDPTDYLDVYGLINPWVDFANLAFLTNPTIPAPNQGLGAVLGARLSDHVYVVAGFSDPNADASEPFEIRSMTANSSPTPRSVGPRRPSAVTTTTSTSRVGTSTNARTPEFPQDGGLPSLALGSSTTAGCPSCAQATRMTVVRFSKVRSPLEWAECSARTTCWASA